MIGAAHDASSYLAAPLQGSKPVRGFPNRPSATGRSGSICRRAPNALRCLQLGVHHGRVQRSHAGRQQPHRAGDGGDGSGLDPTGFGFGLPGWLYGRPAAMGAVRGDPGAGWNGADRVEQRSAIADAPRAGHQVVISVANVASGSNWEAKSALVSSPMNATNVIAPYKHLDMWVFDDPRVGLVQEPFVSGATQLSTGWSRASRMHLQASR